MTLKIEGDPSIGPTSFRIDHAGTFEMPKLEAGDSTRLAPAMLFAAANDLAETSAAIEEITSDLLLSPVGKERKLEPLRKGLIEKVARADVNVDVEERYWNAQEAELLAVPRIDPSNAVAAIEDREIRDWWRAQSLDDRGSLMKRMQDEPGNERLMIAMLRSPIPQLDRETTFMRGLWNQLARLNDPAKAWAIDAGRIQVQWARRGIAMVAGLSMHVLAMKEQSIAETLITSSTDTVRSKYALFAVRPQTMEALKQRMGLRDKAGAARS